MHRIISLYDFIDLKGISRTESINNKKWDSRLICFIAFICIFIFYYIFKRY